MTLATTVLLMLSAFTTLLSGSPTWHGPRRLTVSVHVEFDRNVSSNAVRTTLKEEAAAIWRRYGVQLVWSDNAADDGVRLDAIVARHEAGVAFDAARGTLGDTTLSCPGLVRGPLHIWADTVEALLRQRRDGHPVLLDRELGIALGRVLAHELGHALLGMPSYHDTRGLMRAGFPSADLMSPERRLFELSERSASRLGAQVARLLDPPAVETCAIGS